MTSTRHGVKSARGALWALLLLIPAAGFSAVAATTEQIVIDPQTGLAINGYDPVAYFIDGAPKVGRPEFELRFRGGTWRFRNPGNKAAFMADPADYEPRFGGYDPIAVGRGSPTPGNPDLWLIVDRNLYLFFSAEDRDQFATDPGRHSARAEAKWPDVRKLLAQ
jgi:hypothetical protein